MALSQRISEPAVYTEGGCLWGRQQLVLWPSAQLVAWWLWQPHRTQWQGRPARMWASSYGLQPAARTSAACIPNTAMLSRWVGGWVGVCGGGGGGGGDNIHGDHVQRVHVIQVCVGRGRGEDRGYNSWR